MWRSTRDRRPGDPPESFAAGRRVLPLLGRDHPNGEHPKAKHELLKSTIEIIAGVCTTVDEARRDLEGTLGELCAYMDERGMGLMCSGTHPFSDWAKQEISPSPRYAQLIEDMQWMARRLQIFGIHVHVGVRSPKAVAIVSTTMYIPRFLALSASKPLLEGDRHRAGLLPQQGVQPADRRRALPALRLGSVRAVHGHLDLGQDDPHDP